MEERSIYQASGSNSPLRQGEILTGVIQYSPVSSEISEQSKDSQELSFTPTIHPYTIVITQDCDLDWDRKARETGGQSTKLLNSIILCEVETAEAIRNTDGVNRKEWELVAAHRHDRFYFFEKVPAQNELINAGLPELTADFKRVFGVDAATLYRQIEVGIVRKRTFLTSPYLEHFSKRYHSFHSRVALPSQYESERGG